MAKYFSDIGFQILGQTKQAGDVYLFFVGVTNLGIGLELYLKSLISFNGNHNLPKIHDLKKLYLNVNSKIRKEIENYCKEKNIFRKKTKTFYIRGKKGRPEKNSPYKESKNIEEMLDKHKNLFTDFRYMFARGREKEEHFIVEYENLKIFTECLEKISQNYLKNIEITFE
jgi:hypothetical protein